MNLWRRFLRRGWHRLYNWLIPPYRTLVVEEHLPKMLKRRTLYIVQEDGFEEQAAMRCPCGCGRVLQMNLLPDERPCWRLMQHNDGTASLQPSVWRQKDCGSHFWFRRGRVYWCREDRIFHSGREITACLNLTEIPVRRGRRRM